MAHWTDVVDCTGRTVLDLGGYDGGWGAKPALDHGALTATVVDNGEWEKYGWAVPSQLEGVIYHKGDLLKWRKRADIVVAGNVIYHLRHPIRGLAHLRKLTRECCVVKTSTVTDEEAGPDGWRHFPNGEGHPNGTVWAYPSRVGLDRSILEAGFSQIMHLPDDEGFAVVVCHGGAA